MDLEWLRTFLAVVDHGGFAAAAEEIHRSQSRVSAHIANLEHHLGVQLVDRSHRPAVLTRAGEVYAEHARDLLARLAAASSAVSALRGLDGVEPVRLLSTPCITAGFLAPALGRFHERRPEAELILAEHGPAGLEAAGASVGVLPALDGPLPPGLRRQPLWSEPFQVAVPPEHKLAASGGPIEVGELGGERLIVTAGPDDGEPEVLALLRRHGVLAIAGAVVDCVRSAVVLARAGVGVAVTSSLAFTTGDTGGLVVREIAEPTMVRDVDAYWFDVLLSTGLGRTLHEAIMTEPAPGGTRPPRFP